MTKLTQEERDALPRSAFALPEKREYPIHDIEHARLAIQMMHNESETDQRRIMKAVHNRFPQIAIEGMRDQVKHSLDRKEDTK